MNDRRPLPGPSANNIAAEIVAEPTARARPALHVAVELEGAPAVRLWAESYEDEQRLRAWIAQPATRQRILETFASVLERMSAE